MVVDEKTGIFEETFDPHEPIVDLKTEKTGVLDARYSKALDSAMHTSFFSSKITYDLYSAAVVQSLWQMTALTELDLVVTIHAGNTRGDCVWRFFQGGLGKLTALKKVDLRFSHTTDLATQYSGRMLFNTGHVDVGLQSLYRHPGLEHFVLHRIEPKDCASIEHQHAWDRFVSKESDVEILEFRNCAVDAGLASDLIHASRKLVSVLSIHCAILASRTRAHRTPHLTIIANALAEHRATLENVVLSYSRVQAPDPGRTYGYAFQIMPCDTSIYPLFVDWTRLVDVKKVEFTCDQSDLQYIHQSIPKNVEYIRVEAFDSDSPEVSPAVVRKQAEEMLDKLPRQGLGNLTRAHLRIADIETVYEMVDMKFKQVVVYFAMLGKKVGANIFHHAS